MKYKLPKLNYNYDALTPYIDKETMHVHFDKHFNGYTNKFNAALEGVKGIENLTAEEFIANVKKIVPAKIRQAVINNGGGYVNHKLYFNIMGPKNHEIKGKIKKAIQNDFKTIENFKEKFNNAALTHFGSGWVFLVVDNNELKIVKKQNQDSPLTDGQIPIMGIDVWEHAYYLKYKNNRAEYVNNFWNVINWKAVEQNYLKALTK